MKKVLFYIIIINFLKISNLFAQCAMCNASAESSYRENNGISSGLNYGILYMFIIPYILIFILYIIWNYNNLFKKYNH